MKIKMMILLILATFTSLHALEANSQEILMAKAKMIHIKSKYLKNAEKRMASLENKIKILKKKDKLSKKAKLKLADYQIALIRLTVWSELKDAEQVFIREGVKSNRMTPGITAAFKKKAKIMGQFEALCKQKFPADFDDKCRQIFMKLYKKSKE